jgi:hypothetical protein
MNKMSAEQIIAELPKLKRQELELVNARVHELLETNTDEQRKFQKPIGEVLLEFAGKAEGLPADYSRAVTH